MNNCWLAIRRRLIFGTFALARRLEGPTAKVESVVVSPNRKTVTALMRSGLTTWRLSDGKRVDSVSYGEKFKSRRTTPTLVLSPDGKWMATISGEKIQLRDARTTETIREITIKPSPNSKVHFSRDARRLASAASYSIGVWSTETGKPIDSIQVARIALVDEFSPDGKVLSFHQMDDETRKLTAWLWQPGSGKKPVRIGRLGERLWAVCFSADGKTAVVGGDQSLCFWDVATNKLTRAIDEVGARDVFLSPSGLNIATKRINCPRVRVWDYASGKELHASRPSHRTNFAAEFARERWSYHQW